jgi:hypothetical protein
MEVDTDARGASSVLTAIALCRAAGPRSDLFRGRLQGTEGCCRGVVASAKPGMPSHTY